MPGESQKAAPLTPAQAIEKITDHETRLRVLESAVSDAQRATLGLNAGHTPGQNGSADAVLTRLSELGVHPGLCANKSCAPCRQAAATLIRHTRDSARRELLNELSTAATLGNLGKEADAVATAWEKWTQSGRPAAVAAKDGPAVGAVPISTAHDAKDVSGQADDVDGLLKLGE